MVDEHVATKVPDHLLAKVRHDLLGLLAGQELRRHRRQDLQPFRGTLKLALRQFPVRDVSQNDAKQLPAADIQLRNRRLSRELLAIRAQTAHSPEPPHGSIRLARLPEVSHVRCVR